MGKIELIDAETLYYMPIDHPKMVIEGLLSTGLAVLSGDSKIGKSWMVLWFGLKIAKGEPVWGMPTNRSDVVYLALEDRRWRIQDRIQLLTDEPVSNLKVGFSCGMLGQELETELEELLDSNPNIGIIFIDTFQKVRDNISGKTNAYAKDYQDLGALKKIADDHGICIFLVHHNRKERDASNVFHDITGSTGIAGVADTIMVLRKENHFNNNAVLSITGRDIEEKQLKLEMKKNVWEVTEELHFEDKKKTELPSVIHKIMYYFIDHKCFIGTMTKFLTDLGEELTRPNTASKYISKYYSSHLKPLGIEFDSYRNSNIRIIRISRNDDNDDYDDHDDKLRNGHSSSYEARLMAFLAGENGQLQFQNRLTETGSTVPDDPDYDPVSGDYIPFQDVTPDVECPFIDDGGTDHDDKNTLPA